MVAAEHESLRFRLHPSVRLLQLDYPVFDLWQAFHAADAAHKPTPVARAATRENILIRRAGDGIELHQLGPVEYLCLDCLMTGATLGDLTEAALAVNDAPDLGTLLARWAACGVITAVTPGVDQPA
jgi:hypothetical protein